MLAQEPNPSLLDGLENKSKDELLEILNSSDDKKFHKYDRRYKKTSLIEAIYDMYEAQGGKLYDDEVGDLTGYNYQVRYIGTRGQQQIRHNWNSTPSGSEYKFPLGTWVDVKEIDYKDKYETYVKNAINDGRLPQWEVRRYNPVKKKAVNLFKQLMEKIKITNKPLRIADLPTCTEQMEVTLMEHQIMSIKELKAMPPGWIQQVLKIDNTTAMRILDEATEALK